MDSETILGQLAHPLGGEIVSGQVLCPGPGHSARDRSLAVRPSSDKSNSAADTNARDSAIVGSLVLQCGADVETIRKALCRDSQGRPSGPLGAVLDLLAEGERGP